MVCVLRCLRRRFNIVKASVGGAFEDCYGILHSCLLLVCRIDPAGRGLRVAKADGFDIYFSLTKIFRLLWMNRMKLRRIFSFE